MIISDVPQDCIDGAMRDKLRVRCDEHCKHSIEIVNIDHGNNQEQKHVFIFRIQLMVCGEV